MIGIPKLYKAGYGTWTVEIQTAAKEWDVHEFDSLDEATNFITEFNKDRK